MIEITADRKNLSNPTETQEVDATVVQETVSFLPLIALLNQIRISKTE